MPKDEHTQSSPVEPRVAQFRQNFASLAAAADANAMAVLVAEAGGPIVFINDAFTILTGVDPASILSRPLRHLLEKISDPLRASSVATILAGPGSGSWQIDCRHSDDTAFSAAVFNSPLHDKSGQVSHHIYGFVAVSDQLRTLHDQRNEFYALYEQAPGFIAMAEGPQHRFTFANASYEKFVGRSNLAGKTVAEAMPEIAEQGFVGILDEVYRSGQPFVGRDMPMGILDPITGTITIRYCDFIYQAVRNSDGTIIGLFCEGYDVTEQHETADALAELQAELIHVSRVNAMGTMATTLAHELNQPLSAITNYTVGARRQLDKAAQGDGRLLEALQGIEEAAHRASDIIRNLRELTRRRESASTTFDLKSAVAEAIRLVRATAADDIEIFDEIPTGMTMAGDRIQIQQVVINLLRNACDAVLSSLVRQVSVSAMKRGDDLVVCVKDTGSGVSVEVARNLFSWVKSSKAGGMGLGLPISQTIMEVHRGRIWLEHSGAQGSTFCFSVPLGLHRNRQSKAVSASSVL